MANVNSSFVIVARHSGTTHVFGNRWGLPFTSEANAQRSMTRRSKNARGTWQIVEIKR